MTPASLPACPGNHPGIPSVIEGRTCTRIGAAPFQRARCTVCAEIAAKRGQRVSSAVELYGVHKLDWTPPEMWREETRVKDAGYCCEDVGCVGNQQS
jgi:hypothetical protein